MESLIFAFNAIMPIILLIVLGYILTKAGFLTDEFLKLGNKFVFNVALPALLFINVYSIESFSDIDLSFVVYSLIVVSLFFLVGLLLVKLTIHDSKQKGVILQCCFRSNYAIIGIPLAESLGGSAAVGAAAVLSAFSIPVYNMLAVIALTLYVNDEDGSSVSTGTRIKKVLLNILKNPLIIGVVVGMIALGIRSFIPVRPDGTYVFSLSGSLPFLFKAIKSLSSVATPLALVILGGRFDFKTTSDSIREILIGTIVRVIFVPLIALAGAVLLSRYTSLVNFDSTVYPALVALFGTPVAVSSAIMAEQMKNDGKLAAQLVVWTSLLSILTIFIEVVILRNLGLL